MAWLDVAQAAEQLDVDARQVRRLLAGGDLAGQRIGRVWIVDADSVRQRQRQNPVRGRPLAAAKAWAVLDQVGHHLRGASSVVERAPRHLGVRRAPPIDHWQSWLRSRARSERIFVHPGLLDRFDADAAIRRIDVASALGLSVADPIRFVGAEDFDALLARHHADPDPSGPVDVWVLPPLARPLSDEALVAAGVVGQLSSPDARARHAARDALEAAVAVMEAEPA
jgi:hypothetical protein